MMVSKILAKANNMCVVLSIVFLLFFTKSSGQVPNSKVVLNVIADSTLIHDSLFLKIYYRPIAGTSVKNVPDTVIAGFLRDGRASFSLSLRTDCGYFSLAAHGFRESMQVTPAVINMMPLFVGDSVEISLRHSPFHSKNEILASFSGRGSARMTCRQEVESAVPSGSISYSVIDLSGNVDRKNFILQKEEARLLVLRKYYGLLDRRSFELLYSDIVASNLQEKVNWLIREFRRIGDRVNTDDKVYLIRSVYFADTIASSFGPEHSKDYPSFVAAAELMEQWVARETPNYIEVYSKLKRYKSPVVGSRAVASFLNRYTDKISSLDSLVEDARQWVDREDMFAVTSLVGMTNGSKAFPFRLASSKGDTLTQDQFKDKVVLLDFWFTGCGPCQSFYENVLKPLEKEFDPRSVVFIKISIDIDSVKWLKSVRSGLYVDPNGLNLYTNGLGSSHPIVKNYSVKGYPWPVLLDRGGRVVSTGYLMDLKNVSTLRAILTKLASQRVGVQFSPENVPSVQSEAR